MEELSSSPPDDATSPEDKAVIYKLHHESPGADTDSYTDIYTQIMASGRCPVDGILDRSSATSATPPKTYPPISSIPPTSESRIAEALVSNAEPPTTSSVLYLAYGSNLCAKTFLGVRGIRPISQVNVSAPSLSLTFDLPGTPYGEPCFANTSPRKIPRVPLPTDPPIVLPPPPTDGWDKGLIGVVYEVTPEDYSKIIATEGRANLRA